MTVESPKLGSLALAARRPTAPIALGWESAFAPKFSFEVTLGNDQQEPALTYEELSANADASTYLLLGQVSQESLQRANLFGHSAIAWAQAGLSCVAAAEYENALRAFDRALSIDPNHRGAQLGTARALFETGRRDESNRMLRGIVELHPRDPDAAASLGVVLFADGHTSEALSLLDGIDIKASPSCLALRGALRLTVGETAGAIADLRKAVRLRPDWVQAKNALGIALLKTGKFSAATLNFLECARIAPLFEEAQTNLLKSLLMEKRYGEVLKKADSRYDSPALAPTPVARTAAAAAIELSNWSRAIPWLERSLHGEHSPDRRSKLLLDLGCSHGNLGRHKKAGEVFEESVRALPTEAAIINRAIAYMTSSQPEAAVAWIEGASSPEGQASYARLFLLAQALFASGRSLEAAELSGSLLEHDDVTPGAYVLVTSILSDGFQQYERAAEIGERGLRRFSADVPIKNNLAYALLMAGDVPRAAVILDGLQTQPGSVGTHVAATMGLLALKRADVAEGRRLYELALSLASTAALRARVRAKRDLEVARALLLRDGSNSEAIALLQRASEEGNDARPYSGDAGDLLRRLSAR